MGPALEEAGAGLMVWAGPSRRKPHPSFLGCSKLPLTEVRWSGSGVPGILHYLVRDCCARKPRPAVVIAAGNGKDLCIVPAAAGPTSAC